MIRHDVEGYCENCPDFEPHIEKMTFNTFVDSKTDTVITCEHADRCACIYLYMRAAYGREK